jgi:phosphoserine phosphatase RsbU/P
MDVPIVFRYQRALDEFRSSGRGPAALLKRASELISLLDFTTTLSSGQPSDEILEAALLIVMGELGATRGALFVREGDGLYWRRAARGMGKAAPPGGYAAPEGEGIRMRPSEAAEPIFAAHGLEIVCPVVKAGRCIALLGLGMRAGGGEYGPEERAFLESVAGCAGTPIENGMIHEELRRLNRRLQTKIFQLQGLFDITRELTSGFDDEAIKNAAIAALMGQLLVSRCALYQAVAGGFALAHERGVRGPAQTGMLPDSEVLPCLEARSGTVRVADLPPGPLRDRLQAQRLPLAVPLVIGGRLRGFFGLGERVTEAEFDDDAEEFALTLGRQTLAALENVRLHRVRVEKERQDRELQIARDIQRSLFPQSCPSLAGFSFAAQSDACYEVGGDYYDFLPLDAGRLALVIADVSGKGTPASLLMASVHASLQALAGTTDPGALMRRLNRFLFANTQTNKYVTLFYAELDPVSRRLLYVNAGHVPPYRVGPDGSRARLETGGPVLGLIEDADYEAEEISLAPGERVAAVTDGVTEALSPAEEEFGDDRVFGALLSAAGGGAPAALRALVQAVSDWTGVAGCSDDLTAVILEASR